MKQLIAGAYHTSLQVEEGRAVRFRLVFRPQQEQISLRFDPPLPYDVHSFLKIAPTIGLQHRYLVVEPDPEKQDALQIVGISNPEISAAYNSSESPWYRNRGKREARLDSLRISAYAPGHLRVLTTLGHAFDLHEGSIRIPVPIRFFGPLLLWHQRAALTHIPLRPAAEERVVDVDGVRLSPSERDQLAEFSLSSSELWIGILDRVVRARHGGSFIIVPPPPNPALCNMNYKLNSRTIIDAVSERAALEPHLSHDFGPHFSHNVDRFALAERAVVADRKLIEVEDLVASLSAVDGAVIVASDLTILGFGARLIQSKDKPEAARQHEIDFQQHPKWNGLPIDRRPLNSFGTRHTAAVRFCEDVPQAVAYVVSQDGALRVFWNREGVVRGVEPFLDTDR